MSAKVGETRVAGLGSDGELYGVTSITGGKSYRRKPCATCPWRRDAEIGRFPPQAYRESAHTAYDADPGMFACHESGVEKPATCAGFLLANSQNNLGARLAMMRGDIDGSQVSAGGVALYASYREMAEANGVDPTDAALANCRADREFS